ncbi:MAG TPA: hypothetical protein VMS17_00020 [Gemmataceae bacterium]|nr:hypothetical protein [Gemmataceae bacterium]
MGSIVGASAPAGGSAALDGLCMDQAWRTWMAKQLPEFEHVLSMFEMPDPKRPVRIGPSMGS